MSVTSYSGSGSGGGNAQVAPRPTVKKPAPVPPLIDRTLFGMHPGARGELPILGSIRLWDTGTTWAELQPAKGVFNWAPLDAQLARARSSRVSDVLMVLAGTPQWAATSTKPTDYLAPGVPSPPKNMADWDAFVRAVATRYKGRIPTYQVWNEFNLSTFWRGTPEQMAAMTARAYSIIKKIDRKAVVVAPSTTVRTYRKYDPFTQFYPRFLTALAKYKWPVDVFAVHAYPAGNGTIATHAAYIARMQATLVRAKAPKKPLWETEINFGLAGPGPIPRQQLSDTTQAAWLAQTYLDSLRLGVSRAYWYAWQPPSFLGITTWTGTPATKAFTDVQSWTVGARWRGCTVRGTVVTCTIQRGSALQQIVYTTSGTASIKVPVGVARSCAAGKICTAAKSGSVLRVTILPVRLSR